MTCVFYETGDDAFFKRIAEVFSSIFTWYIFINIYNEVLQPGGIALDRKLLEKITDHYKTTLKALNCSLFPAIPVRCKNDQCKKSHKVVLASDQVAVFETAIEGRKKALVKEDTYVGEKRIRYNLQEVIENFMTASYTKEVFEHININAKEHPGPHSIEYKLKNPDEYKESYIRQAKGIRDKTGTKDIVYVRAGTHTEYPVFEANLRTTGVTVKPCDELQVV
jgi:hypothetical protein